MMGVAAIGAAARIPVLTGRLSQRVPPAVRTRAGMASVQP
jgi:hypothetical protein